jgi:hypothetical protein
VAIRSSVCPESWLPIGCGTDGALNCTEYDALDTITKTAVLQAAVDYLWNWSGRRFGVCPVVIRPCRESCFDGNTTYRGHGRGMGYPGLPWYGGYGLSPALIGGEWFNLPCGGSCSGPCSCGPIEQVDLGGGVDSINSVTVNGIELAESAYRLDNSRYLVRTDGGSWPDCQDMASDPMDAGSNSFAVSYNIGLQVPAGGQLAAGALACELAKAMCGSASCKLPQRVQRIARQGVEIMFDDMETMWSRGGTGIFLVDSWLASVNVSRRGGRVASVDWKPTRRTT